jgi:hypothetical protein
MQTVGVPGEDSSDLTAGDRLQHRLVLQSALAGVGRDVVVHVDRHDLPTEPFRKRPAVGFLVINAEPAPARSRLLAASCWCTYEDTITVG